MKFTVFFYQDAQGIRYSAGTSKRPQLVRPLPSLEGKYMSTLRDMKAAYGKDFEPLNRVPEAAPKEFQPKPLDEARFKEILAALNGK